MQSIESGRGKSHRDRGYLVDIFGSRLHLRVPTDESARGGHENLRLSSREA